MTSDPVPLPIMMGTRPAMMTATVIAFGRTRNTVALYQTEIGRVRAGLQDYANVLRVPGSPMRKIKGSVRTALALPRGLVRNK